MSTVVLEHHHSPGEGLYRLVVAEQLDDERQVIHDFVWADDDDRWFTGQGTRRKRRADKAIAGEQRAAALEGIGDVAGRATQPPQLAVSQLPGVGDEL